MEDKRAQENTQRAREMWAESMRLKKEVEGMVAAQELQKENVSVQKERERGGGGWKRRETKQRKTKVTGRERQ